MDWPPRCGRFQKIGLSAVFLSLAALSAAHAALIDVQFTEQGSASYSGAAVVGSAGDTWNTITGTFETGASGSGVALKDVAGAATGVTLSYATGGVNDGFYDAGSGSIFYDTAYAALLDGLLYSDRNHDGAGSVTLSGLTPGQSYTLILYSVADHPGRVTDFTVAGVTQSVDPTTTTVLTDGVNYTDFTVQANASGDLTISFAGTGVGGSGAGAYEGDLNGLQLETIASVPEPASLTLMGAGLLLTLAVRRKVRGTRAFPG